MKTSITPELAANIHQMRARIAAGTLDNVPTDFATRLADALEGLDKAVNTPHTADFLSAVKLEAAHQRERWAAEHDAGKSDEDWLFLSGFLGGKAVQCGKTAKQFDDPRVRDFHLSQRLHHIITGAAVLLNWHAAKTGNDTRMRPGIAEPSL